MDVQRARALFVAVGGRVGSGMYRSQAERYKAMTGMVKVSGRKGDEMDVTRASFLGPWL